MDWFSWLSKTDLESYLVYNYGLAFSHNELEEEDMAHFNHELLQSMGISVAKHRLEILKLARKHRGGEIHSMSRVIVGIKRTKKSLAKYLRTLTRCEDSAIVVVPRPGYSTRWRGDMLKRAKKMVMGREDRLLLTNESPMVGSGPRLCSFSSPMIYDVLKEEGEVDGDDDDDGYWSTAVEEIRWDTMFQNLKPT